MTTTLPLVGLMGRARSGKNAVASILAASHGYTSVAFADPLRKLALGINPIVGYEVAMWPDYSLDGETTAETPEVTPIYYADALDRFGYEEAKDRFDEFRRFLQRLGTDGVREVFGAETWVDLAEDRVREAFAFTQADPWNPALDRRYWHTPLAFTDVRFPNEAKLIRKWGGLLVRVERPAVEAMTSAHVSETALDGYEADATIVNDGTLDDLARRVDDLVLDALAMRT